MFDKNETPEQIEQRRLDSLDKEKQRKFIDNYKDYPVAIRANVDTKALVNDDYTPVDISALIDDDQWTCTRMCMITSKREINGKIVNIYTPWMTWVHSSHEDNKMLVNYTYLYLINNPTILEGLVK